MQNILLYCNTEYDWLNVFLNYRFLLKRMNAVKIKIVEGEGWGLKRITKFGMLLSFFIILVLITTGCAHLEIGVELNKDKTGSVSLSMAVIESLANKEDASMPTANLPVDDSIVGVEHKTEKVSYEDRGNTYIGEKEIHKYKDIESFLRSTEGIKIVDLPDGNKKLEYILSKDDYEEGKNMLVNGESEVADGFLSEDFNLMDYDLLVAAGLRFDLKIKTDYEVVNHNADKAENGVYTWDLLKRIVQEEMDKEEPVVLFIEYKPVENESYGAGLYKRTEINKLLGIAQGDKDSYGRALNKLGILKGTDAGLELVLILKNK